MNEWRKGKNYQIIRYQLDQPTQPNQEIKFVKTSSDKKSETYYDS